MVFKGYTQIGEGTLILIRDYLEIGRYTRIGFLSFFMDSDDHFTVNMENQKVARNKAPIIIGKYNWIANKTVIKKNTKIPDYTIVASSNTLLSKDYTENGEFCVLGGIPAKVIRFRFDQEQIGALLKIRWWDWSPERIRTNIPYLSSADISGFIHRTNAFQNPVD